MTLLRRTLKVQAALWAIWSLAVGLVPRLVLEDVFDQPELADYAWVRASAVMGLVLALLMVLVAQRVDELWWWAWAFIVLEVGTATVFAINAITGPPDGAPAWPWWMLAAVNAIVAVCLVGGMGIAGQEKPFV
jgi:hypothetical protein